MSKERSGSLHDRWARLRFSIVGPLLASPPARGALAVELESLSRRLWLHPVTEEPVRFAVPTIEHWLYQARSAKEDPVTALKKKVRKDAGAHPSLGLALRKVLQQQHEQHRSWSCQLHADNLAVVCEDQPELGCCPSYSTVRRYMRENGLFKQRRVRHIDTSGGEQALKRLETCDVLSYEVAHVHGLWHSDFHDGSRSVLTREGWKAPQLVCFLDDHSRVACHTQWYLDEQAESFTHGFSQALQKRGLPRSMMTDGGAAMRAGETQQGFHDLSIIHAPTLPYSPYQNAKQEVFWAQVEGRLMAMLEGVPDLTLGLLNEATQAWVELEYNRKVHSEIGMTPLSRMLAGPSVGRACPSTDELRRAFRLSEHRTQRRSDGTISVEGMRFEVPSRLRHVERLRVRYARWDLSTVDVVEESGKVVVATLYPLDKTANADGHRRRLDPAASPAKPSAVKPTGMAPLLRKLVADYRSTGLPPAYLPKHDTASLGKNEDES